MAPFRSRPVLERTVDDRLDTIARQRQALEGRREPLSKANKFHLTQLKEFEVKFSKELEARRRALNKHIDSGTIRSPAGKIARSRFFQLVKQRTVLRERADAERRRASFTTLQKPFVDRNSMFGNPLQDARTIFGTKAYVKTLSTPRRYYKSPELVVPCLDRLVRREVLFAKGHGGKGHHTRKRRGPLSMIGC